MSLSPEERRNIRAFIFSANPDFRELGFMQDEAQLGGEIQRALKREYAVILKAHRWTLEQFLDAKRIQLVGGNLQSLDLSGLASLENLICSSTNLNSLTLNNLPKLRQIICANNQLTSLNLDGLIALTSLSCSNNKLTSLDLRHCHKLGMLSCTGNQLTEIILPKTNNLTMIFCEKNKIKELDISHLTKLKRFEFKENPGIRIIDDYKPNA
ncbi:MAG: hypothetical protein GY810_22820 [Aureispira sp.]|nr:hypothetical protein [Aureispira sp.]